MSLYYPDMLFIVMQISNHERERERERDCKRPWTKTRLSLHGVTPTLSLPRIDSQTTTTSTELQLTTFSKFANFCISKFRISLVWCHLIKLLRHFIRIPNFHRVFHFLNQTYGEVTNVPYPGRWCTRLNFQV